MNNRNAECISAAAGRQRTCSAGFTLIELMVTIAVAAILLTVAAPSFINTIRDNHLSTTSNTLISTLGLARSEAIKRKEMVTVCASSSGTHCSGGASWEGGWIAFVDTNANGSVDSGETILRVEPAVSSLTITGSGFDNNGSVQYESSGLLSGANSGTLSLCDSRGASDAHAVNISATGHPSTATDTNGDGTVEDADGNDLTCS